MRAVTIPVGAFDNFASCVLVVISIKKSPRWSGVIISSTHCGIKSDQTGRSKTFKLVCALSSTTNDPLPSKISGNVQMFSFYKNMYFILFYAEGSTQRKHPGPQRGDYPGI